MTTNQVLTGLVTFILGGGLMLSVQRAVAAYRAVKGGKLSDTGTIVDRLEAENARRVAEADALRVRVAAAEEERDREAKARRAEQKYSARLERQLIRADIEPEGHPDE